ncbi:MAG TPA: hypothetical protein VN648_16090 [Candidatus Methylomirabilis sp.]|nr:hypothetical protein [Candidatus Methylomirabilis sp.]
MSISWVMVLVGLGMVAMAIAYRLSVRPPRCPSCRMAAHPTIERLLHSWPAMIEVEYRCLGCEMEVCRRFIGDALV